MSSEAEKMETETPFYTPGPNAVDISPAQDGGVMKEILKEGEGEEKPNEGNKVSVHYTGKLLDGTVFDSSVTRGEMFEFTLGKGEVIKAWDIGIATMKKGEKCILLCKPEYAYGEKGSPPKIGENATLVFEVELYNWEMQDLSESRDKGILRLIIKAGSGFLTPQEGSVVEVHLVGRCNGREFENREVKFELGEGSESGVVSGLETALEQFKKGEKSKIILAPKYAFGAQGNPALGVPANASVEYVVELKAFEKVKEAWSMSAEEKLEQSEIVKNKGTDHFKNGKFALAIKQYKKIVTYLQFESDLEGENKAKRNMLLSAGYFNMAACHLKLENYEEVIANCNSGLEIDAKNAKGLFRKGQALLMLRDYEEAKDCFSKVLELDPSNKAAQKSLYVCKDNLKKQVEKEKKMYQAIFKKMAAEKDTDVAEKTETQQNGVGDVMETDDDKTETKDTEEAKV